MLFDDVVEVQEQVEEFVSSRFKRVKVESTNETFSFGGNLEPDHGGLCQRLKEWTGKARSSVVYDSTVDEFTADRLFNKVGASKMWHSSGSQRTATCLGGSSVLLWNNKASCSSSRTCLSFRSIARAVRDSAAVRLEEEADEEGARRILEEQQQWAVFWFYGCEGWFYLGDDKSDTFGSQVSHCFVRTEDITLTGEVWGRFICCRLVSVQKEETNVH